jgi:hypothetical protein
VASRTLSLHSRRTFGLNEKQLSFRIIAGPAAAPLWATPVAVGGGGSGVARGVASVSRLAVGKFLITLEDAYAKLCSAHFSASSSDDAAPLGAQGGVIANVGTSTPVTVIVKTKSGAGNADPVTVDADTHIDVDLVFEDSGA